MSTETRPVCPKCTKALVYQPSIKSYRCNPCCTTYTTPETKDFKQVEITVYP